MSHDEDPIWKHYALTHFRDAYVPALAAEDTWHCYLDCETREEAIEAMRRHHARIVAEATARFRALAERWLADKSDAPEHCPLTLERCAAELLALLEEP